jgi:hypothetical protein
VSPGVEFFTLIHAFQFPGGHSGANAQAYD